MNKSARALFIGLVGLWGLLAPNVARAADACTATVDEFARELTWDRCKPYVARASFLEKRPESCVQAMRDGTAPESLARILGWLEQPIGPALQNADCIPDRQRTALFLLCALHPPQQQERLRRGITRTPHSDDTKDAEVVGQCMNALLEERDAAALTAALNTQGLLKIEGALRTDALQTGFRRAVPHVREQLAPLLREAHAQKYVGRDALRAIVCQDAEPRLESLRVACTESTGNEEWQQYVDNNARIARVEAQKKKEKRLALTALGIGLAALQVGLTVPYRDSLVGKIATTAGGMVAGTFVVLDVAAIGFQEAWPFGLPFAPIGALAVGAGAFGSTYDSTAMVAFSSVSAAFSLASFLAITWKF